MSRAPIFYTRISPPISPPPPFHHRPPLTRDGTAERRQHGRDGVLHRHPQNRRCRGLRCAVRLAQRGRGAWSKPPIRDTSCLLPPADWCPIFASRATQEGAPARCWSFVYMKPAAELAGALPFHHCRCLSLSFDHLSLPFTVVLLSQRDTLWPAAALLACLLRCRHVRTFVSSAVCCASHSSLCCSLLCSLPSALLIFTSFSPPESSADSAN